MRLKTWCGVCAAICLALWQTSARGSIGASATLSSQQLGPTSYQYSLSLTNTGTTPIGTFWFAWIPGFDFLQSLPTNVQSPSGWLGYATQDSIYGGYSAQWYYYFTTPLQPGDTLTGFGFDSSDSPAFMQGTSNFGFPVETSYVYMGAGQNGTNASDPGTLFDTVTAAPEPVTGLILPCGLLLLRTRRRYF